MAKSLQKVVELKRPESLWNQCLHYIGQHLETIASFCPYLQLYELHKGVILDTSVCEALVRECFQNRPPFYEVPTAPKVTPPLNDAFFHIFIDTSRTRLRKLDLLDSDVSDVGLAWLMKHAPAEVSIGGCKNLTSGCLQSINAHAQHLKTLHIGNAKQIVEQHANSASQNEKETLPVLNCPVLLSFSVHELSGDSCLSLITKLVEPLTKLNRLDLSSCEVEVHHLSVLCQLKQLYSLILYDVPVTDINLLIIMLSNLTQLRMLDLSQKEEHPIIYPEPEKHLSTLVNKLSHLKHLDLSGTNLAGFQKDPSSEELFPAMPWFGGRQFEFLGLMNCSHDACQRQNLPANNVTGDANEEQILLSLRTYLDRPGMLPYAIKALNRLIDASICKQLIPSVDLLLCALKRYPHDLDVQLAASASFIYISRGTQKPQYSSLLKRKIITTMLDGAENHLVESGMFAFARIVRVLLIMVSGKYLADTEQIVPEISVELLCLTSCRVSLDHIRLLGVLGTVEVLLHRVKERLERQLCDVTMSNTWATLWNIMEGCPENCEQFVNLGGIDVFTSCSKVFGHMQNIMAYMLGLMINIAEVSKLKHHLMKPDLVTIFSNNLESSSEDIELSYNACGVLAHLVSDGPGAWTINDPPLQGILSKMVATIRRWKLETKRNIFYRSYKPFLELLSNYDSPVAQHWTVWVMANFSIDQHQCCPLLVSEGGVDALRAFIAHPRPSQEVKELARGVISRCNNFMLYSTPGKILVRKD